MIILNITTKKTTGKLLIVFLADIQFDIFLLKKDEQRR
jgi:hypothetical protein